MSHADEEQENWPQLLPAGAPWSAPLAQHGPMTAGAFAKDSTALASIEPRPGFAGTAARTSAADKNANTKDRRMTRIVPSMLAARKL
jgi:hypothetical protein